MLKTHVPRHPNRHRRAVRSALLAGALAGGGSLPHAAPGAGLDPALYGRYTEQLLVYVQPDVNPDELARRYGLKLVHEVASKVDAFASVKNRQMLIMYPTIPIAMRTGPKNWNRFIQGKVV